jgi:hypothetical protein
MPQLAPDQPALGPGRIQFRDAGFEPHLEGNVITLGPGQLAMVGYGAYAALKYDFGIQDDVVIPRTIVPLDADFESTGSGTIAAGVNPPTHGVVRVIIQQYDLNGQLRRTWAGGPPNGENMGKVFALTATQGDRTVPIKIDYDKVIWSGLSWAVGEIDANDLTPGLSVTIRFHSEEKDPVTLKGAAYLVEY